MESENVDHSLLARYLANETSAKENKIVEQWIADSTANEQKFKQYREIWEFYDDSQIKTDRTPNSEKEWDKLQHHFAEHHDYNQQYDASKVVGYQSSAPTGYSLGQKLVRIAAVFIVATLLGIFAYQNWYQMDAKNEVSEPTLRQVSTANAQRANMTLGDGTKVMLNADSRLKFPDKFAQNVREVFLEGEAFFNVKRNPKKPFMIHSANTTVKVLGTSFAVRSYPKDKQVYVVVEEGRVSFKSDSSGSSKQKVLTDSERGIYSEVNNQIQKKSVGDLQLYLSWRKGYLKFQNKPMADVAKELERRYDIKVIFEDQQIARLPLTAYLKSKSIQDVLGIVAKTIGINYKLNNNTVRFYSKSNTN